MNRSGLSAIMYMILPVIVAAAIIVYAGALPTAINAKLAENVFATRTVDQSRVIHDRLDGDYRRNASYWSVDWAAYRLGEDGAEQIWMPNDMPTAAEIESRLEDRISDQLKNYYTAAFPNSMCATTLPTLQPDITDRFAEEDGSRATSFSIDAQSPVEISCDAPKGRTTLAMPPQFEGTSQRTSIFYLHEAARTVLGSDTVQDTIENTADLSSQYMLAEKRGGVGICSSSGCSELNQNEIGTPGLNDVREPAQNKAEADAGSRLDTSLDSALSSAYRSLTATDDDFKGIDISYTVEEVEFRVAGVTSENVEFRVSGCRQSCYNFDEESKACGTGCSADAADCPQTYCSTTSYGSSPPSTGPNRWTGDPWTLGPGERPNDPYSAVNNIPWNDGTVIPASADIESYTVMPREIRRGSPESDGDTSGNGDDGGDGDDDDECTGCYDSDTESADNDVQQTAREIWKFDEVRSFVRISVEFTDTRRMVQTPDGLWHPSLSLTYDQVSVNQFGDGLTTGDVEDACDQQAGCNDASELLRGR